MNSPPSPNGRNGTSQPSRDASGRFVKGWKGGPGNPMAAKVHARREAIMRAVRPKDLEQVMRALVKQAKLGDMAAAREVLDRCVGKARQAVEVEAEVKHDAGDPKAIEDMTDLEIAQTIRAGGLKLPPILERKVALVERQAAEQQG